MPDIEYGHVETPGPMPGGYKGVGEGGAIGAPPAVVNAVNDALAPFGVALTRLPLTPARIVEAIVAGSSRDHEVRSAPDGATSARAIVRRRTKGTCVEVSRGGVHAMVRRARLR